MAKGNGQSNGGQPAQAKSRAGAFLAAADLSKTYFFTAVPVPVLKGVHLSVKEGEFVAVVGASGSGKSTLLHCIGLLDQPTAGAVFHEGRNLTTAGARERDRLRNRLFGFVFQFFHLLPELSALENVLLPTMIGRNLFSWQASATALREEATNLLRRVGLAERMRHRPRELSGGEQQRVAIARALVNHPRILLADEPTGNLDERTGVGILDLLERLNREERLTLILVTHDPEVAGRAHRVLHLRDGVLH